MTKHSFGFLSISLALVVCFIASSESIRVDRFLAKTWCIAKPGASEAALQQDIDEICGQLDCSSIRPGGACYDPNTVPGHASVALNLYYKQQASQPSACGWGGSAWQTVADPSYGSCQFP